MSDETFKVKMDNGYEFSYDQGNGVYSHHIRVKLITEDATPPKRATEGSAGLDLYLNEDVVLYPGEPPKLVGTGVCVEIPTGYVGVLALRSGVKDCWMNNGVGIIDSDYRGEVKVKLSAINQMAKYSKGSRIAQLVILPYLACDVTVVSELSDTQRGTGGFGSTGNK